jgi:hypothetical protein
VRGAETETDHASNRVLIHRSLQRPRQKGGNEEWGKSIRPAIDFGLAILAIVLDARFSTLGLIVG